MTPADDGFDVAIIGEDAPELREWFESGGMAAVVLRPDRYILGGVADIKEVGNLIDWR